MAIDIKDTQALDAGAANIVLPNFAVAAAAGDFIVAAVAMFGTKTWGLPTDTLGSAFEAIGTQSGGANTQIQAFLAKNIGAGTDAVTFVRGAWGNASGCAWLIRGGSANPYNLDFFTLFNTSTTATFGPTTKAVYPGSIFLTFVTVAGTADVGDPTGYNTEGANGFTAGMHGNLKSKRLNWSANEDILSAYKVSATGDVESGSFPTSTGNQQWASVAMSFAPPRVPAPTSASPSLIATIGGDAVTVTGTKFGDWVTGVTIGGVAATNVLVVNDTTITCTAPAHAAGAVDVVVTAAEGNGTAAGAITYAVKPVPTGVIPQFALLPASGQATIKGSGFLAGATVDFGGVAATNVVVVNSTTITCDIPAHSAGQAVITVTNP